MCNVASSTSPGLRLVADVMEGITQMSDTVVAGRIRRCDTADDRRDVDDDVVLNAWSSTATKERLK